MHVNTCTSLVWKICSFRLAYDSLSHYLGNFFCQCRPWIYSFSRCSSHLYNKCPVSQFLLLVKFLCGSDHAMPHPGIIILLDTNFSISSVILLWTYFIHLMFIFDFLMENLASPSAVLILPLYFLFLPPFLHTNSEYTLLHIPKDFF